MRDIYTHTWEMESPTENIASSGCAGALASIRINMRSIVVGAYFQFPLKPKWEIRNMLFTANRAVMKHGDECFASSSVDEFVSRLNYCIYIYVGSSLFPFNVCVCVWLYMGCNIFGQTSWISSFHRPPSTNSINSSPPPPQRWPNFR